MVGKIKRLLCRAPYGSTQAHWSIFGFEKIGSVVNPQYMYQDSKLLPSLCCAYVSFLSGVGQKSVLCIMAVQVLLRKKKSEFAFLSHLSTLFQKSGCRKNGPVCYITKFGILSNAQFMIAPSDYVSNFLYSTSELFGSCFFVVQHNVAIALHFQRGKFVLNKCLMFCKIFPNLFNLNYSKFQKIKSFKFEEKIQIRLQIFYGLFYFEEAPKTNILHSFAPRRYQYRIQG